MVIPSAWVAFRMPAAAPMLLDSGLFIVVSAIFTANASLFGASTAWQMWLLYVCVTAATLVCFRGFLAQEFDYKVR
jgi:hypothetical protein